MKRIIYLFISLSLLILLSGCKTTIVPKSKPYSIGTNDKIGKYFKNYDTSFNDVSYKKLLEDTIHNLESVETVDELIEVITKAYSKTNELINKYYVADALYHYDNSNEEYKKNKDILSDCYYEYEKYRASLIYEASKNEELIIYLFEGYSQEDIEFEINLSKKQKEDEYVNLQKEIDDIIDEFDKLDFSYSDSSNEAQIAEILYRFISKNKELSNYLGFESYIQYKDVKYSRTYSSYEANEFIKNVKEYILPLMDSNRTVIDLTNKINKLSYAEYNYLIEFDESSFLDTDYRTIRLANDYAKKIGGSFYQTYRDFTTKEKYIMSNKDSSLDTAYTNSYLSYFGKNYQSVTTLMHEFGHFYAYGGYYANIKSLDLNEFYSQGNELLFMSYLEKYGNLYNVYDTETSFMINNCALTMVIGSSLREFEEYVYNNNITGPADLIDIWNNINDGYNSILDPYWKFEVRYDAYYISYATSSLGALSLYNYSKTNFMDAANAYVNAVNNMSLEEDLSEILVKNNLDDPFKKETFEKIKNLIMEKRS